MRSGTDSHKYNRLIDEIANNVFDKTIFKVY